MTTNQTTDPPTPPPEEKPKTFSFGRRTPNWSSEDLAHLEAIRSNPENRTDRPCGGLDWAKSHQNNKADWDALLAEGRTEGSIRGKIYTSHAQASSSRTKQSDYWPDDEVQLLQTIISNRNYRNAANRISWSQVKADNPPEYSALLRNHSAGSIHQKANRLQGWVAPRTNKNQNAATGTTDAQPPPAQVVQFGVNFCPECGKPLTGYHAAKSFYSNEAQGHTQNR